MEQVKLTDWLGAVNPEQYITELLLPGTHDTMTAPCPERYYHTQTLSLIEQLQAGVRFLDIRLRREMVAAHREWISNITADEIFSTCAKFLQAHPTEFILMRVQNANEKKDDYKAYGSALQKKIAAHADLFYHWKQESDGWMKVSEAAGKIVALECAPPAYGFNRIHGTIWAQNWHDNDLITLEDLWDGPELADKEKAITEQLLAGNQLPENILSLIHISATNGKLGYPDAYAKELNPYMTKLLSGKKHVRGTLIYDFMTEDIGKLIVSKNF